MKTIKRWLHVGKKAAKHFFAIEGLTRAAELAYTTLLSIVPIMILSLGLFSAFPSFSPYAHRFHEFLFEHLVPSSARAMQHYIELFAQHSTKMSAAGLFLVILTSILLIFSMETAFNKIWKVKERRKGFQAFLLYWAILTLLPPIAATAFALSILLFSLPVVSTLVKSLSNFSLIFYLMPILLIFIALLILYRTLPNCEVKFRCAAIGAAVATPLFELMKWAFGSYVTHFSSFALIYGAAAIIPIFLIWLYVLWVIVIIGAVVAHSAGAKHEEKRIEFIG